jgi:YrbI family 3-deoxy-D-manno-octulosonate 8-phosphate phosphatase
MDNMVAKVEDIKVNLKAKALKIKLLLTDCDGVLTDGGVYYSRQGEEMKLFSLRDGMGVERLRRETGIDVGIITGENSAATAQRAAKLKINELHQNASDKLHICEAIMQKRSLVLEQIAYIGDDYNDLELLQKVGLSAAPADALPKIKSSVDYVCSSMGGHGAFREFVELVIGLAAKTNNTEGGYTCLIKQWLR